MKTLVIGDIHGCHTELQELLDKAGISSDDALLALGDIVDRGPDSPRVLEFFVSRPNAQVLMGNHERKHVRSLRGEIQPALSQVITRRQFGEAHSPAVCAAMAQFPRFLELPEALLVHAFFEPGVPLEQQRESVLVGTMSGDRHLKEQYDRPWYELYDGEKPIIVGHHDYSGRGEPLVYRDQVFGLDTGCSHGRALTEIVLPDFKLLTVPSERDYWDEATPATAVPERTRGRREMADAGETALDRLYEAITREHERVLGQLRTNGDYDALSPQEQGKAYAAHVGDTSLAPFLHGVRKGTLTRDSLRRRFRKPAEAFAFAQRLGLLDDEVPDND